MKKIFCFTVAICLIIATLIGCTAIKQVKNGNNNNKVVQSKIFNEDMAILKAIKDHPEFPDKVGIKEIKVDIGGKQGYKCPAKLETKVEPKGENTYNVILTKTLGIKISNTTPVSYWKYSVSQDKIILLDSVNNADITIN